ncbi:hypothetical protein ABEX38_30110 [Priestia megaterium]
MIKRIFEALFLTILFVGLLGGVGIWYFGIPYLVFYFYTGMGYWFYLSIWLLIHMIGFAVDKAKLTKELKELKGEK